MNKFLSFLLILGLMVTTIGCGDTGGSSSNDAESNPEANGTSPEDNTPPAGATEKDIVDTAIAAEGFTTLVDAVKAAELVDALKAEGPLTVFAPTDEAFKKIPEDKLKAVLADKKLLTSILTYHVVKGKVMAADVVKLKEAETLQGGKIMIKVEGDKVMLNDKVAVIKTDIKCRNGVIHVIDTVLMPPTE